MEPREGDERGGGRRRREGLPEVDASVQVVNRAVRSRPELLVELLEGKRGRRRREKLQVEMTALLSSDHTLASGWKEQRLVGDAETAHCHHGTLPLPLPSSPADLLLLISLNSSIFLPSSSSSSGGTFPTTRAARNPSVASSSPSPVERSSDTSTSPRRNAFLASCVS
jgi:hypothetical protein